MSVQDLLARHYADPKFDGTGLFYGWLRDVTRPGHRVLNLGAGPETKHATRILKGEVAEIVGADIDPVVLENRELDAAVLIENGRVPLESGSFDLIFSDFVLEHVEKPDEFLAEVMRLLKPGGSYMFRTPNLWHYVAIISRFTPQWFHELVANKARGMAEDAHEPWPTFYRMNTRARLKGLAAAAGFRDAELRMIECEPSYLMFNSLAFRMGMAWERTVNATEALAGLRSNIQGRLVKPG
jgi:SAM-dependent methyltransferase